MSYQWFSPKSQPFNHQQSRSKTNQQHNFLAIVRPQWCMSYAFNGDSRGWEINGMGERKGWDGMRLKVSQRRSLLQHWRLMIKVAVLESLSARGSYTLMYQVKLAHFLLITGTTKVKRLKTDIFIMIISPNTNEIMASFACLSSPRLNDGKAGILAQQLKLKGWAVYIPKHQWVVLINFYFVTLI